MSAAIGFPTMLLRPTITQSAPAVVTPYACSMYSTPAGVHGAKPSRSPIQKLADVDRVEIRPRPCRAECAGRPRRDR